MIKVAVVCEDHRLDEYIIKPVLRQMFAEHGRKVHVRFAPPKLIQGIAKALEKSRHQQVFGLFPMVDGFFLLVDRDCDTKRVTGRFTDRLRDAETLGITMFGCLAIEELEVWALALHRKELAADWNDVRSDCDPKEHFFEPFVKQNGWQNGPGKGRKAAVANLSSKWDALKNSCPEVAELSRQIGEWLHENAQE